jgi:hypothetical protein
VSLPAESATLISVAALTSGAGFRLASPLHYSGCERSFETMRTNLLAYLIPLGLLAGCGGADPNSDAASVSGALDSSDQTANDSAMMLATTSGTESAASSNEAATMAGAQSKTFWQPSTCLTATQQLNIVTYKLNDCTGPYGLVHVTGTVVVTYTKDAAGIHADAVANGLAVNGATMNLDSQAVYSVNGTAKKLVVTTAGSGTGALGNSITRAGSYTLQWDDASQCGALDGAWSTKIGADTWSTSIIGYAQCKAHCPSSGTLSHTGGISKVTITVTFDGSADAKWSTSRGKSGTIALFCAP